MRWPKPPQQPSTPDPAEHLSTNKKPRILAGLCLSSCLLLTTHYSLLYCNAFISCSSVSFGGRISDCGRVAKGSSTMFNKSVNVGFCVSM